MLIDGAPDEARRFKTSVLKELAITSVVHGCKRGLDKSFAMKSLCFCLFRLNVLAIFPRCTD